MSSIVNEFNNVTKPVVEKILHLYSIFGISIYKIQKELNEEHNVDISHQTIERILLGFNFNKKHKNCPQLMDKFGDADMEFHLTNKGKCHIISKIWF